MSPTGRYGVSLWVDLALPDGIPRRRCACRALVASGGFVCVGMPRIGGPPAPSPPLKKPLPIE